MLPLLLTHLVHGHGMSMERLIELTSRNAALRFGLPGKGSWASEWTPTSSSSTRASAPSGPATATRPWTIRPTRAWCSKAWPYATVCGGTLVFEDGKFPSRRLPRRDAQPPLRALRASRLLQHQHHHHHHARHSREYSMPRSVILDVDTGTDDAIAIMMAALRRRSSSSPAPRSGQPPRRRHHGQHAARARLHRLPGRSRSTAGSTAVRTDQVPQRQPRRPTGGKMHPALLDLPERHGPCRPGRGRLAGRDLPQPHRTDHPRPGRPADQHRDRDHPRTRGSSSGSTRS